MNNPAISVRNLWKVFGPGERRSQEIGSFLPLPLPNFSNAPTAWRRFAT